MECLALPPSAIMNHARRLSREAKLCGDQVLHLEAVFWLMVLGVAQCELDIQGAIGEIGTTRTTLHPGKVAAAEASTLAAVGKTSLSVEALALVRRANDTLFFCGPFGGADGDACDLPERGFDLPTGARWAGSRPHRLRHLAKPPSAGFGEQDLLMRLSGGAGFRVLRLDRARGGNESLRVLRAAADVLVDGGLLLLEGVQGMSDRPGLQEGFHRFMLEEDVARTSDRRRLVPFLWAGKRGGLFLANERHARIYQDVVKRALPAGQWLNTLHDTKFLYGSRVVTAMWEAEPKHFEALLARDRSVVRKQAAVTDRAVAVAAAK